MSASLNQADLPAREFMCVNDASACKCLTEITTIPGLTLVYRAAHTGVSGCSPVSLVVGALHSCFSVEKCQICTACACLAVFHGTSHTSGM